MNTITVVALALLAAQAPAQPTPSAPRPPAAAEQPARPDLQPAPPAPPAGPVLTLGDALRAAAERNQDLKAAQARLRQSDELTWKAWSGYLPQLTIAGNYTRNQFQAVIPFPIYSQVRVRTGAPGTAGNPVDPAEFASALPGLPSPDLFLGSVVENITIQKYDQLGAQAELDQALFAPQLWFLIPSARRGREAAGYGFEATRRDILFGVAQAYYGVSSLRKALDVTERLLEIAQRQEKDARVRYQAGTIAKVGLLRAEIDRARAEQDLKRARASYESGRIALATLLDRKVDFEIAEPPEPQLPGDTAALEEAAVRERPELQAARAQVEAARAARNAAVARYLPSVGAFARWQIANIQGFTGQYDQWAVGLGLQWSILDGGRRESDIREANARVAEAEAAQSSTELRVRQEVQQALLDLESARANAVKAKEQRDLAAENQRLVDVSYRAGAATAVEQADATAALRNAEIAYTAESLNAQLAAVRVLRAAGEFQPVPKS